MADNTTYTPGSGATIAADDIAGVLVQRVKVQHGADGSATDVSSASPMPTTEGGTYGYAAGTSAATVDVPTGARVKRVSVLAGSGGSATVTIAGGNTITIPASGAFDEQIPGLATAGGDVVIGGTVASYYVSWVS